MNHLRILEKDWDENLTNEENYRREVLSVNKNIETIYKINVYKNVHLHTKKSIYRFRETNEDNIDSLLTDTIYLANPNSYNDPYDSSTYFDFRNEFSKNSKSYKYILEIILSKKLFTNEEILKIKKAGHPYDELQNIIYLNYSKQEQKEKNRVIEKIEKIEYDKLSHKQNIKLKNKLQVACFSQLNTSIIMWSIYAKHHEGFCLEYDIQTLDTVKDLYPVVYSNNILPSREHNIIECGIVPLILVKSIEWKHEEEIRLIKQIDEIGQINKIKAIPKAIYLGIKFQIDSCKGNKIIKYCQKKNIEIYQARMRSDEFKLEFDKIKVDLK